MTDAAARRLVLLDIGSTVIKIARCDGISIGSVRRVQRDFTMAPAAQVTAILGADTRSRVRMCSSANGGLRVGVVAVAERFSGQTATAIVQEAGGNVVYCDRPDGREPRQYVDLLVVVGGVDRGGSGIARSLIDSSFDGHPHGRMVWAGSADLAAQFIHSNPTATVVPNVLRGDLGVGTSSLGSLVRRAYLDDLVDRHGIAALRGRSEIAIAPTPSVVSEAYRLVRAGQLWPEIRRPCAVIDIGGATTDVHLGVELLAEGGVQRSSTDLGVIRHVFAELGVQSSRRSLLGRLAAHGRLFKFLSAVYEPDARVVHERIWRGDPTVLDGPLASLGCLFLALAQLTEEDRPNRIDLRSLASVVVTGGAVAAVSASQIERVLDLLGSGGFRRTAVHLDREYALWAVGLATRERVRTERSPRRGQDEVRRGVVMAGRSTAERV